MTTTSGKHRQGTSLILIVDDNPVEAARYERVLSAAGYLTKSTASGKEALKLLDSHAPSLVVLDVMLPDMDGYEVCRRMRSSPLFSRLPILMLTGLTDVDAVSEAYAAGASEYLSKPIRGSLLLRRVKVVLGDVVPKPSHYSLEATTALPSPATARWEIDADTGKVSLSKSLAKYFGIGAELSSIDTLLAVCVERDRVLARAEFHRVLTATKEVYFETEISLPNGSINRVEVRLHRRKEELSNRVYVLGFAVDVSARKNREVEAIRLAYFDPLTDLPNRLLLAKYLRQAIADSQRSGFQVAAINIDLDLFSRINLAMGHQAGDEVLQQAAKRLSALARFGLSGMMEIWDQLAVSTSSKLAFRGDLVATMGGDSFMVLLIDIEQNAWRMDKFAEKVKLLLSKPFYFEGRELFTSASVGIAMSGENTGAELLIQQADIALHEAKRSGRNAIVHFKGEQVNNATELLSLQSDLRLAMERGEFCLHFQPKVSLADGKLAGFEALIRWDHPARGFVSPAMIISLSEETGLIVELGAWVLREACLQILRWHEQGLTQGTMAVNVSARQLRDSFFMELVDDILEETGVPGELLEVEITENVLITDPGSIANIKALRRRGISIALDDFGTGYSSMSYLLNFPFDTLKIDRSFVKDIQADSGKSAIVGALSSLSHTLEMKVVVEGVETQKELELVRQLKCDQVQGYFICKPKSAEHMELWLRRQMREATLRLAANNL